MSEETTRGVLKWQMTLAVLWGLGLIPAFLFFTTAVITYDPNATGSLRDSVVLWGSITAPLTYLVAFVVGIWASRGARTPRKNKIATFVVLLPFINVLAIALMLI